MLRPKRRLFRRRATSEWIKDYAYAGVTLLALAGGAVAWGALFNDERPPSGVQFTARPEPAAVAMAQPTLTPEADSSAAPTTSSPPSMSDTMSPPTAAEPATAAHQPVRQRRGSSKSPAVARLARRTLASSAGAPRREHAPTRSPRTSAAHETFASATPSDAGAYEQPVDRAYVPSAPAETRPQQQDVVALPAQKIERASSSEDCSRLSHTFGGMRSVRSECSSGDASGQSE